MYDRIEQCRVDVLLIGFKKKEESDENGALVKYSSVKCIDLSLGDVSGSRAVT